MQTMPYILHALSPLHLGTGQAAELIDLPIARMRSTGIPIGPGSGVKGVLREARRPPRSSEDEWRAVFGPEDDPSLHAGALAVTDARLLALPVRAFRGTFAWVSSPLLLHLAARDVGGNAPRIPEAPIPSARVPRVDGPLGSLNVHDRDTLFLEDLDLEAKADPAAADWADWLAPRVAPPDALSWFSRRFVVVDDETMSFLSETATQVDTRVRIDPETGTAADKQLWTEESLPPETLLIGLLAADRGRRQRYELEPTRVFELACPAEEILRFGGKATVGRGRCRFMPQRDLTSEAGEGA